MRDQVWMGILEANRLTRYYSALADQMRWRQRLFSVTIAGAASGAAMTLLAQLPDWISAAVLFATALAAIWSHYADYSGKAAKADSVCGQYQELEIEWRGIWFGETNREQVEKLQLRDMRITTGLGLNTNKRLNDKSWKEARDVIAQEFNAARG